jgi:hypothetical protein
MKNWKTTLAGVLSAAGSFVLFAQASGVNVPKMVMLLAAFMQVGGLAGFGIVAKDYNVSGSKD